MNITELSDGFFMKSAGWEAVKNARALLAAGKVISSNWTPPLLKGVVSEGTSSYRAGLVIKDAVEIDNLCTCRASREAGIICAHSVAVGLQHLLSTKSPPGGGDTATPLPGRLGGKAIPREPEPQPGPKLKRDANGDPFEISVILPPTFAANLERGKVMVTFEGKWSKGRVPLSVLPMDRAFSISPEDTRLLDKAEELMRQRNAGRLMLGSSAVN